MTDAPIQIRHPDVVRDIRALADRLGLTMTEVVAEAVRRRLAEENARDGASKADLTLAFRLPQGHRLT